MPPHLAPSTGSGQGLSEVEGVGSLETQRKQPPHGVPTSRKPRDAGNPGLFGTVGRIIFMALLPRFRAGLLDFDLSADSRLLDKPRIIRQFASFFVVGKGG